MQQFEYLQVSINYYSAAASADNLANNEAAGVWTSFNNYLDGLTMNGWVMISETEVGKGQSITYQFKRAVDPP